MTTPSTPKATGTLESWLSYLESIHSSAIDLGLERMEIVANKLSLIKPAPFVITVAGTNGKGSTCAILEAILLDAGYRVGVYSSPHIIDYNERVRINGEQLDNQHHINAFEYIESHRGETSLSFFEFGTLAALHIFKQQQLDIVILEVGLGGRLDSTNVVDHDISIITSLAVDHVDWLGDDINQIGYEKAGIFRKDKPAICGEPKPPASVAAYADEIGAELHQVGYQFSYKQHAKSWDWFCGAFDLTELPLPNLPVANAATAIMALGLAELELSDENIVAGLKQASLPGRMQTLSEEPLMIADVAHNPHSAKYLAEQLSAIKAEKAEAQSEVGQDQTVKIHAVVGMLKDKDIAATLAEMDGIVDLWYPVSLTGVRAATAEQLQCHLPQGTLGYSETKNAIEAATLVASKNDIIIVFGSFHTIAAVS
ncbi:bifunctional tetrahydrofolate synthase/dihydrofolate synthase [Vibrio sp. SS-MA-C1-2]|uniref:bifunctional tetrahydrofolate synthase/dihydrofolate synthase n=1 Tax=Vibrio sp. SS-MA-C1-2 TaxID=2908646 RepID=UPI001F3A0EE0|nr:bifunctional tetrahydrofolate synthase/dihydrofolate synthase [Vibrio sp. SS-MA-C1-2]UJF18776.1 bifunctional tetrahydrofolate synthase/dihydrofolate synthase [Vibrio sp. SS-MA-C1-2]